jgi:hypothetical protein
MKVLERGKTARKWLSKHRPHMARGLAYTDKVLNVVADNTELTELKIVGLGLSGCGYLMMKWHNKRIVEAKVALEGVEDVDKLSPEQQDLLEFLAASRETLENEIQDGQLLIQINLY